MPKLMKPVSSDERIEARERMLAALDRGEINLGTAIRRMRVEWTGLSQGRFGKIAGVSANTMSAIERDAESATVRTLNQILRRFGMRLTLRQISMSTDDQPEQNLKGSTDG
ncbi:helix-turn-helix domain-containing protein [Marinobacter salarius]|uniref:DNA-binding transcriptional repressor PuuR n=1 Tax=Marinobacter salarius TaxID=1420917 RepID=A0A1W6KFV7_9GAMM|nr:helix-turn-helix domain-containing protein [Marinobacter salarius]ARM86304.1 DNA-binding transcriptional repressor PuuR [Marinobacter salarius]